MEKSASRNSSARGAETRRVHPTDPADARFDGRDGVPETLQLEKRIGVVRRVLDVREVRGDPGDLETHPFRGRRKAALLPPDRAPADASLCRPSRAREAARRGVARRAARASRTSLDEART